MQWVQERFPARLNHCLSLAVSGAVFLAVLLGFGLQQAAAAPDAVITDIRVGQHASTTRVVLDVTNMVTLSIFSLDNPYRVVVDLPQVGWQLPARPLPQDVGQLDKLRYGLFKPGNSRLVLDLKGPARVVGAFVLRPTADRRYRAVIDLESVTRQAFLAIVKSPRIQAVMASVATLPPVAGSSSKVPPPPRVASPPPFVSSRLGAVPPPRKPKKASRRHTIVIDPGHGGADPGTTGVGGSYEKHITLAVARAMKRELEKDSRYRVILTRNRDVFVRLRRRITIARDAKANLFISVHADAIKNANIRGLSVYTLSENASDKEAAALAEKENKADLIAGVDLTGETDEITNILIELAQRETMNQSARFASMMVRELSHDIRLLRNTHRFAGFTVLKAPDVPSALLELGFLSNRADERELRKKSYRIKMAVAVRRAIDRYFYNVEEAQRP